MMHKLGSKLRFYFHRSLPGYFYRQVKSRWFMPSRMDYHGITLQVDNLPLAMQAVLTSGSYEIPELSMIPGFISPTDQVLELGGAIGFIGLYCIKQIGITKWVTVEPNPITVSQLRHNYALNGIEPTVIQAAIADNDGPVSFHTSDMFWSDSLFKPRDDSRSQDVVVDGLTFPNLWKLAGSHFNALVIDIEGAEQYLSGTVIPDCVRKLIIEIHPEIIGTRAAYTILESLIRSGFTVRGHEHNSWALAR